MIQPRPRGGRASERKSDRTRRRVLNAAKQLFDRKGYRDTTIDDITRRANIAHGTFYLYFHGKRDLLKELLEQTFAEFDAIVSVPFQVEDIHDLLRKALETYQRNQLLMRVLREASAADAFFREHYDEFFVELLVNHLCQTISSLQELVPESSRPVDPRGAARAIVGMIESFAYGVFIGGEDYSLDLVVDTLTHFCVSAIAVPASGALDLEDRAAQG
ncbi:MAG TPA: TetR/AcrR family transcriptional regulator [Candidatus Solibacter sp.]|jgi:AcrR family transcriptional regulator|nr:TetR/AcrR family transcriptional regulator [Candidatus Solibacter sp.]